MQKGSYTKNSLWRTTEMKKAITLLLAAMLALSLTACGGGAQTAAETGMTKEEMLSVAEEIKFSDIFDDYQNNKARTLEKYCGNIFTISYPIGEIDTDYLVLYTSWLNRIKVYLSRDELLELDDGDYITVVGKIGEDVETVTEMHGGTEYECNVFSMKNAYFVTDIQKITGVVFMGVAYGESTEYTIINGEKVYFIDEKWVIEITDSDGQVYRLDEVIPKPVNYVLGQYMDSVEYSGENIINGGTITVTGKLKSQSFTEIISISTGT